MGTAPPSVSGYDKLRPIIRFSHRHVYSDNCSCLIEQHSRTMAVFWLSCACKRTDWDWPVNLTYVSTVGGREYMQTLHRKALPQPGLKPRTNTSALPCKSSNSIHEKQIIQSSTETTTTTLKGFNYNQRKMENLKSVLNKPFSQANRSRISGVFTTSVQFFPHE